MVMDVAYELLHGFLLLFINPVFYIVIILSILLGLQRVKLERLQFHVRVHDVVTDVYNTLIPGLIAGLILSIGFFSLGFIMNEGTIVLLIGIIFLLSVVLRPSLLTPSFVIAIALFVTPFLGHIQTEFPLINDWMLQAQSTSYESYFLLLVLLMLAEALLILLQAKRKPSPRRLSSKRGQPIGGFETKRLWFVPIFLLIPGLGFERMNWWPLFNGNEQFTFILVPFVIGFQQLQTFTLPERAITREGRILTLYSIALAPIAYFTMQYGWALIAFIGIVVTLIGRVLLHTWTSYDNRTESSYFTKQDDGIMILSIIPKTPASLMDLKIGEVIRKVNDIPITSATEFYGALQKNATFCKLEVIDEYGEMRFEQRALYHGEHHELGILFVDKPRK